jgi:flagellar basal-body rod protein FlgF
MDGIDLMAQAMHVARTRLDVSAANLANVSTPGFRRSIARARLGSDGMRVSSELDRAQGPLERTGRAFDVAIAGNGSFAVRDRAGRTRYERSASLDLDRAGHLSDERGAVVLGRAGPVHVASSATIDARGFVHDESGRVVDRLRTSGGDVRSGFLERANVDAVHEMVDVLAAQRAFETAQTTLSAIDGTRAKAASDIPRVNG